MPWVTAAFKEKRNTFVLYRDGTGRPSEFDPISSSRLDQIPGKRYRPA
jgi:hypothetical protein